MRQVNCHIRIKVRITGRLSGVQFEEFGEALMSAVAARIEQARRTIDGHGHAPVHATVASARESFDPARLSNGRYGMPSYDSGGETVGVPVVGNMEAQLEEKLRSLLDSFEELSKDLRFSFEQRAYDRRVFILLGFGPENAPKTDHELEQFIDWCYKNAKNEDDTLDAAPDRDELLFNEGAAFPKTWAQKFRSDFYTSADPDALWHTMESALSDVRSRATYLVDDIWENGLPVSLDEASNLGLGNLVRLGLNSDLAKTTSTEPIIHFTQALLRFERATAHYWLVHGYKTQLASRVENIRKGEGDVIDRQQYESYTGRFKIFQVKLNAFKEAASSNDLSKSLTALLLWDPSKFDRLRFDFGRGQREGVDAFWAAIETLDARIDGTGRIECVWRAGVWADARHYYYKAGVEIWKAIKEDKFKIIGMLVAIFVAGAVAQAIPGLNVALDLVLLIKFGVDGLEAAIGLAGALKDAASAKSVVEMERASAELARKLIGAVADVVMWVAGLATNKIIEDVLNWRKVEKFLKTHGDTPATRDALLKSKVGSKANAKANLEEAEKILAKKLEYERQQRELAQAEQRGKAAEAERKRKLDEEGAAGKQKHEDEPAAAPKQEKERKSGEKEEVTAKPGEPPPAKPSRTLDEIKKDLQKKGITPDDISSFRGNAQRLSAAVAKQVVRLVEHFSPAEVKQLGEYFSKNKIVLTEELVDALIQKVPPGRMSEYISHLDIVQVHGGATKSPGLAAERGTLEEKTTVHPGKPPLTREIVETPGSQVLRANLIKRFGEEPPPDYHAHHIIPEKQFGPDLDWMRNRLRDAGKSINDSDNGVFLAARGSTAPVRGATANSDLTMLHNSYMHAGLSKEYAYTLTRRLGDLHGRAFLNELRKIGEEMSTSQFKIDEIPRGWKKKWQPGMTAPIEPGFEPGLVEE